MKSNASQNFVKWLIENNVPKRFWNKMRIKFLINHRKDIFFSFFKKTDVWNKIPFIRFSDKLSISLWQAKREPEYLKKSTYNPVSDYKYFFLLSWRILDIYVSFSMQCFGPDRQDVEHFSKALVRV